MIVNLTNIQAIKSARYDLEEKGITQITGENSNGKSILIKAMEFVANDKISDAEERETIINDDADVAVIKMERNGVTLTVTITRERENCQYLLTRKDGSTISRTIREGGLTQLAEEFGWVSFEGNICLQIFETFGIMPFVNNRPSSDYSIVDYIITDKAANNFVDSYENVTYPAFKKYAGELNSTVANCQKSLDGITFYNIPVYEDILSKLKKFQRNVAHLYTYTPTRLPITKAFKYVQAEPYVPKRLPIFRVIKELDAPISLFNQISKLATTLNGECPTCGVKLKYVEEHKHDI